MTATGDSPPSVQAQLSVRNGRAAVDFYIAAFGAKEVYRFGGTDDLEEVVSQLAVGNTLFWVEDESPPDGNFSPEALRNGCSSSSLIQRPSFSEQSMPVLGRFIPCETSMDGDSEESKTLLVITGR